MASKIKIRRSTWNTYAITGYSHQVGTDARATGGVHSYQVRRVTRGGRHFWQKRVCDSNGRLESAGPVAAISEAEGEALFARAEAY